jgi:hypothetical protein
MYAINRPVFPHSRRLSAVFIIVALMGSVPLAGDPSAGNSSGGRDTVTFEGQRYSAPQDYEFRASIPNGTELDELSSEAEKISHTISSPEEANTEADLIAVSDYHALFPCPLEQVVPVFTAHGSEDEIYPRITFDRDLTPERGPLEPHFQVLKTSFTFLGIGATYHYILYRIPEYIDDDEFLITETLTASLDGSFSELYVSWYLREVVIDGTVHTYLRNRVKTGFIDPPAGTRAALQLFGGGDVKNFFSAVRKAAEEGF